MEALRYIQDVSENGILKLKVPKSFGRKVEIILLPAPDKSGDSASEGSMIREGLNDEEVFLAATFQAAIEDDPDEDAVWRKYIK